MIKLIIYRELTDLNTYIKAMNSHRLAGNSIKQSETNRVHWEAKKAHTPPVEKSEYPVHISYKWYSKDRRIDIDNVAFAKKFINDGLVQAGIIENDSRKFIQGFDDDFDIDRENPRVEVTIMSAKSYTQILLASCK